MTEKNEEREQTPLEEAPNGGDAEPEERDEDDVDQTVEETFPASDPPAW